MIRSATNGPSLLKISQESKFLKNFRTDNCVKNHFYSKLRKALRHLNKVIKQNFRKEFKEMKIGVIYKIIEALEDRFKESTAIDEEIV